MPKKNTYQSEAINLSVPFKLKNENKILTGLVYQRVSLRFDSSTSQQHYFNTGLNLGFVKKTGKGAVLLMLVSRANTDFIRLGSKDFQSGGVVLVSRKSSENFTLKYGLYYNSELFGPFLVPLLGLDWKLSEKYRIFGIMPQNFTVENKVNNRFRWGLAYLSPTLTYYINAAINPKTYLHQNQTRIGIFGDFYLTKSIVTQLKIDFPFPAKYRIFDASQKYALNIWGIGIGGERARDTSPLQQLTHGLIFQLGINYRVEL